MEVLQEIPCIAILNKQKMSLFFFYKIGEQEARTGSAWVCVCVGVDTSESREEVGKGCRG
jgi:hypothetical protein